ncbi:synaptonemal complex protein 2-like isoform X6 [Anas acuta]|uniref:synaptonemal complex protein 2-like isoform X6 n=1 Tax=Anas acuta TaxID=28680 RepID=UPI0035C8EA8C
MEPLAPGMGDTTASEAWGDCETLGDDRRKLGRGREEESQKWSKEMNDNMAARAEDYLESLLTDAFKGKGFQKISDLLQGRGMEPLQKYSESLFFQLDKALRKELDKNEFHNVSLLLKCVQLYLKSDLQQGMSLLIEQGLVDKVVSWFERTRGFVTIIDPNENHFLMALLEDFFDSALVICKCSNEEISSLLVVTLQAHFIGKKQLVNLFLPELGHLVTEGSICCALRLEALRTLNSILDSVPREERKKFPLSEEICSLTNDLAKTILEVGDYDLQVALSEALCRLMTKKWRDDLVHHWFEDNYLAEAFKEIKDREFETDCRKFLNQLNERLGDDRRVYSFPCISAFADMNQVKKPSDEKLEEFWIDFNTGSQSVTFYIDSSEGALWDSVRLLKDAVSSYSLKEGGGEKIVKIYMKIPATLNKTEATKIKICFSAEYEILNILKKVLGEEKMMTNVAEEDTIHSGNKAGQTEAVTPQSSDPQKREDLSVSENVGSPSEDLFSQHNQSLAGSVAVSKQKIVNSGITMVSVGQQTDMDNAHQGSAPEGEAVVSLPPSAKKSKTLSPRTKAKTSEKALEEPPMEESTPKKDNTRERRNGKKGLAKQMIEDRKDSYGFESSDSASHEKVAEAKGKLLGQKTSSRNLSVFSYRKHLFSGSNHEKTSNSQSEKSWILDSQKQPLPKSLDYTRKRRRVRRKVKVLPVSSASSGSDYRTQELKESRRDQKEMLKKTSMSTSKGDDLPTVDLAGDVLSEELEVAPLSLDASAEGLSDVEEKATQKFQNASDNNTKEEENFKRKDSDVLSGTVGKKPKLYSQETKHLFSDAPSTPKKLFDSDEKKEEIQIGQEMEDEDDVFYSEINHEDTVASGMITAFESFISQRKKLFWSRYKRMEMRAQNTLRTSEETMSVLLNQIHERRLNKLDTFQKTVVEELASLEKETQILSNMEKDAMRNQRIQSADSALGEETWSFASTIQDPEHHSSMNAQ